MPDGLPGSTNLRMLDVSDAFSKGSHWLVVSTVPEDAYGEEALDRDLVQIDWVGPRALAHEAVVEHFLGAGAVLPMQLFTIYTSEERALADVRKNSRRIARMLDRIDGHVEWGVRLTWQGHPPSKPDSGSAASARRAVSGASYLVKKRDLRDRNQADFKRARTEANRLYRAVSKKATKAVRRTATEGPGSRVLLDAAFLVRARNGKSFEAAVRREARTLEQKGIALSLTGPWPAYNFV